MKHTGCYQTVHSYADVTKYTGAAHSH